MRNETNTTTYRNHFERKIHISSDVKDVVTKRMHRGRFPISNGNEEMSSDLNHNHRAKNGELLFQRELCLLQFHSLTCPPSSEPLHVLSQHHKTRSETDCGLLQKCIRRNTVIQNSCQVKHGRKRPLELLLSSNTFPTQNLNRSIALIPRGTCSFGEKVFYAQLSSASAVIVFNNDGDDLIAMSAEERFAENIVIPAAFVGESTGIQLLNF